MIFKILNILLGFILPTIFLITTLEILINKIPLSYHEGAIYSGCLFLITLIRSIKELKGNNNARSTKN